MLLDTGFCSDVQADGNVMEAFPSSRQLWLPEGGDAHDHHHFSHALKQAVHYRDWAWPDRTVFFFSDPHADAEAFWLSLRASGLVDASASNNRVPEDVITLTKLGRESVIIIGGDCFDKGPSNLGLFRLLTLLKRSQANLVILAGNHDMRLLVGLRALRQLHEPLSRHLFLRMGSKVIPLLREVYDVYGEDALDEFSIPELSACRDMIYPSEVWFDDFATHASWLLSDKVVRKELRRLREKRVEFEQTAARYGLDLRQVMASAAICEKLFLEDSGEFSWFFASMVLAHREGSFLFIHAGVDDQILGALSVGGLDCINGLFKQKSTESLFEFYFGPLANTMRTKYRETDYPLTHSGVEIAWRQGIHAVVHGHRNRYTGQRLTLRKKLLHMECDITMDRHSRLKENLVGQGYGVTIVHPSGYVNAISADHRYIKHFTPSSY